MTSESQIIRLQRKSRGKSVETREDSLESTDSLYSRQPVHDDTNLRKTWEKNLLFKSMNYQGYVMDTYTTDADLEQLIFACQTALLQRRSYLLLVYSCCQHCRDSPVSCNL